MPSWSVSGRGARRAGRKLAGEARAASAASRDTNRSTTAFRTPGQAATPKNDNEKRDLRSANLGDQDATLGQHFEVLLGRNTLVGGVHACRDCTRCLQLTRD